MDDPEACLQWCQRVGLLPETRRCSKCRRNMALSNKRAGTAAGMRWRCHKCSKKVSLASGTVFEESRLPLGEVFLLIYCSVNRFSHENAFREASMGDALLSSSSVAHWYKISRDACVDWATAQVNRGKMGGAGSVVEVDEAKIGHRKYNRGRLVEGTWVLGLRKMVFAETNEHRVIHQWTVTLFLICLLHPSARVFLKIFLQIPKLGVIPKLFIFSRNIKPRVGWLKMQILSHHGDFC